MNNVIMSMSVLESVREYDFLEYYLFPKMESRPNDTKYEEDTLNEILQRLNTFVGSYCKDYIWHKDGFRLVARTSRTNLLIEDHAQGNTGTLPPHLYGVTHYGDNIQDEWFIVALLFELSKQETDLVVRICDSDGEFLLIEAAEFLPSWASPDTCEQRVYIFNGRPRLICDKDADGQRPLLPVADAVNQIRGDPDGYLVLPEVEKCIVERIKEYPEAIASTLHRSTVYVPVGVATILRNKPALISAAVRAFVDRDPIDIKAMRAMRYFPPENRVKITAIFTKCVYAMAMHSSYVPDVRTGWKVPPPSNKDHKSHLLGLKLACGFEILASQAKPSTDLETDRGWIVYLENLKKRTYFQDFIEGSKDYQELLHAAQNYYRENRDTMKVTPLIGQEIINMLRELDAVATDDEATESDDDSWLNITPEELDKMLDQRYGVKNFLNGGNIDASKLGNDLTEFLERESEYDGIVTPADKVSEKLATNKSDKHDSKKRSSNDDDGNGINFDPDAFVNHVKGFLDFVIPEDNWESNSEMSDYEDDDDLEKNIEDMTNAKANAKSTLKAYMDEMDKELSSTTIGKSFEAAQSKPPGDDFDDIESFKPVDIDVNTLKNMCDSYKSQFGGPGPAANLLTSMRVRFEDDKEDKDGEMLDKEFQGTQV